MLPPPRKKSSNGKTEQEKEVPPAEKVDLADLQTEDAPMMAELSSGPAGLAADHLKSASSDFFVEPNQTAVDQQLEPSNPPANQDQQQAAVSLTEKTEGVETKLVPTRRKSKVCGPIRSLQELRSETDSDSDSLKDSSAEEASEPPVRSPVAEEAKEMPAFIPAIPDPSAEVVKTADPEVPMRKKSKSFQVSTTAELVSSPGRGLDTLCEEPAEPEKLSTAAESGCAPDENKPLPPKRKSKGSEFPLKSDAENHPAKDLPEFEGQSYNDQTVVEELKLVPTRRKSKNGQGSINSETLFQVNSQKSSNAGMAVSAILTEENKAKLSPMQRKPKGPKHTAEAATKETGKKSKEADRQQSLEKIAAVRRRSKTSLPVIDLESKDAGKEGKSRSVSLATQGGTLTPESTARKSPSPKISPKPSHNEEVKASEKKHETSTVEETPLIATSRRSKDTEASVVDKGKLSPAKRKPKSLKSSKDFPTRESSSPKMPQDKAKSNVLDKGKLSPTKRKPKTSKPSKELSTTELPKGHGEPLAPEMVKESPDITEPAVEEIVQLSHSKRKSKDQQVCLQLSEKELVQKADGSDLYSLSPALDMDKAAAKITMEENNGTSVVKFLAEGLKESPELSELETTNTTEESDTEKRLSSPEEVAPEVSVTGFMQTKEEPDTERPQSPSEMVPTDVTDIKAHSEDQQPNSELSDQETSISRDSEGQRSSSAAEEVESDGQEVSSVQEVVGREKEQEIELFSEVNPQLTEGAVPDEAPVTGQPEEGEGEFPAPETLTTLGSVTKPEEQESTNIVEDQKPTLLMENNLPHLPSEPANARNLFEYIDTLWKDTDENERRYLVLDVPEVAFSQTSDRAPVHLETEVEPLSEQDVEEPDDKDASAEAKKEEDTARDQHTVFEGEGRPNQELAEPLETCPSKDPEICIHREEAPEEKIIITADVTLQKPPGTAEVKDQEQAADVADTLLEGGSAESISPSEFIEISFYESSQIESSREPLEVAGISSAPLQEQPVREEPELLDENYVKMEKIEKGSEVHIFPQDTQISVEEETMSVKITKEPTADVNLHILFGKDSGDLLPEIDTVELTVLGGTTEDLQEEGPAQGREQVSGTERSAADLQHEAATGEEAQEPKQNQLPSSQSLTQLELKDKLEAHANRRDEGAGGVLEALPGDGYKAADSLAKQEPREESNTSLEMVSAEKDGPASEVRSDTTVAAGDASESPSPIAPPEQQVTDTKEEPQDQENNPKIDIRARKEGTTEVETVGLPPPTVKIASTLEEIPGVESPQVRCYFIFA